MKRITHIIITILMVTFASSCHQEIDLEKYYDKPVPVINSVFGPDTVVMASISHTIYFTQHRDADLSIKDADVNLYVNSRFIEHMTYNAESRMYMSHYVPEEGDTVRITADTSVGYAEGCDVVPRLIPIESLKNDYAIYEDPYHQCVEGFITFNIKFNDPGDKRNYYCVRVENMRYKEGQRLDYSYDEVFISQHPDIDFSFNEKGIYADEGMTFTDAIFDGTTYTLKVRMQQFLPAFNNTLEFYPRNYRVMLYSLTESYYNYLTGILNNAEPNVTTSIVDWGLAEPSPHYTNVVGGTGIVAGVRCSYVDVDIVPGLKDLMDSL